MKKIQFSVARPRTLILGKIEDAPRRAFSRRYGRMKKDSEALSWALLSPIRANDRVAQKRAIGDESS